MGQSDQSTVVADLMMNCVESLFMKGGVIVFVNAMLIYNERYNKSHTVDTVSTCI